MRNLIIAILVMLLLPLGVNASMVQNVASLQPKRVVVIDPGHGGPRPGKVQREISEKDYVLDVSRRVKKRLGEKMPDLEVYLTRSSDSAYHKNQNDDNKMRAQFSNKKGADLYVAIHANALENPSRGGCEAWVLTLDEKLMSQNSKVGERYADDGDFIDPKDIDRKSQGFMMVLSRQLENEPYSRFFAQECCNNMAKYGLKNLGVKAGTVYTVLYYSECPGVIVELAYLTNNEDYNYLMSKNAKDEMATAISDAIITYFKTLDGMHSADGSEGVVESEKQSSIEEVKPQETKVGLTEGYTIQLISSLKEVNINDSQFKSYKGRVRLVMGSGSYKYKYCYGAYATAEEAKAELAEIRNSFKDAYVVRFRDGSIVTK